MTVVVGTAGHIDHGKTSLLRALTGIDADRLPEERRRGMTIDVGYAHLGLPDGRELDFVDVPGHDRLVGNMLVGAGEIDAALLVVAADDGPRAQTREHLELLDALEVSHGLVAVTKTDLVATERVAVVAGQVAELLRGTTLEGSPILAVSSEGGEGIDSLRAALLALRDRVAADAGRTPATPGTPASRLAIDRVFTVKGRGTVVTGTLRGGPLGQDARLRLVPGEQVVRVRGLQVHGRAVERAAPGRTAIALAGVAAEDLHRGMVLTDDPAVRATDRLLVRLRAPLTHGRRVRLHLGTASVDAAVARSGRDALDLPDGSAAAIARLAAPIAAAPGDRFVLRRGSGPDRATGGLVLDVAPARGISRRRQTVERVARLAESLEAGDGVAAHAARLDLHGALAIDGRIELAPDVREAAAAAVLAGPPATVTAARAGTAMAIRRLVSLRRDEALTASTALLDGLVEAGRLVHDGEQLRLPGALPAPQPEDDPVVAAAMDRLEAALASPTPPALADAAAQARCPQAGVRRLEQLGRIVVLEPNLAYASATFEGFERTALDLAARSPLTPAALRDATGTSRKYVMAILEDLDRRGALRRTPSGHVPGPRAGLMIARPRVAAIVLAGGRSRRFGRDKLAEVVDGRPLLAHAVASVRAVADEVIVVAGVGEASVKLEGVRLVHDRAPFEGPLAALAVGLRASKSQMAIVIGGDMPSVQAAVATALVDRLASATADAAVLEQASGLRPLPMAVRREPALAAAERLLERGERSLRALVTALGATAVPATEWQALDPGGRSVRDVDTPADLG